MKFYIAGMGAALLIALASALFLPGISEWVPASLFIRGDLDEEWVLEKKANVGDNWQAEVTITLSTITENGQTMLADQDCQGTYYSDDRNFRVKGPCAQVTINIDKQVATRAAPSFSV